MGARVSTGRPKKEPRWLPCWNVQCACVREGDQDGACGCERGTGASIATCIRCGATLSLAPPCPGTEAPGEIPAPYDEAECASCMEDHARCRSHPLAGDEGADSSGPPAPIPLRTRAEQDR